MLMITVAFRSRVPRRRPRAGGRAAHCGYAGDQQRRERPLLETRAKEAVVIDLPADIKEVLVADQKR